MSATQPPIRVLLIDDNLSIHDDFRKVLEPPDCNDAELANMEESLFDEKRSSPPLRFEIDSATQGEQGFEMVKVAEAAQKPYALAFVDMRMPPGWDGLETIEHLWTVAPELQVVICSAYSDYSWSEVLQKLARHDGLLVLKKPFDAIEVHQMSQALSTKWLLHQEVKKKLHDLELMVASRTSDLLGANQSLRAEIKRRKEAEAQLIESQKLEGLGQMAAGIAHEINNPMAFVTSNIESLNQDIRNVRNIPAELREYVDDILPATLDGIERVNAIIADVRRFARSGFEQPVAYDLHSEVSAGLRIAACRATKKHILDARLGPVSKLTGRPTHIGQLVINLVVNAIQAMPEGGKIQVSTREEDDYAILEVSDDGPGMSEAVRRKLFEPFFTTKPPGQGTGLGLAVCHGIIRSHGGEVTVDTDLGKGTCFAVRLPIHWTPEVSEELPASALPPSAQTLSPPGDL